MEKKEYMTPQADLVELQMEKMIADSPQLENPENGGDIDPWGGGVISIDGII